MSPPASSNGKRASSRPVSGSAGSKKAGSRSSGSAAGSGGAGGKRSASNAALEDGYQSAGAKRTKRNASSKKSLREEELGVGAELAEDDMIDANEGGNLDEEGDEGDGGVTRCVCGEDNEEMASGLMIQCDTCKCWQHGPCVGLWEEKECPNRYFCELCKPNLHGPGGLLRKVTRKTSAAPAGHAVSPPTAPPAASASHKSHKPRESADSSMIQAFLSADGGMSPEQKPHAALPGSTTAQKESKFKRSTMNSRDAAYDDAIALSILEAGTAAMRAKLEKTHESEGEQSDVEEIVISGPGNRGKSKKGSSSGPGKGSTAKGGRVSGASARGGKSSKTPRGRRETSNLEEEAEEASPGQAGTTDNGTKEETLDAADGALADRTASTESQSQAIHNGAGGLEERRRDNGDSKEAEPSRNRSKLPEVVAAPQPVHSVDRSKHPNQYTYRAKNGLPPPPRGGKSPTKRGAAAASTHSQLTSSSQAVGSDMSALKPLSSAAAEAVANWGMPDHLRHLAHLLPNQSPPPLSIVSLVDPTEPPSLESATRVRFPGKRVTMPEMRKRARTVLEFVTKVQLEMSERDRRWNLLRDVNEQVKEAREKDARAKAARASGSASGSGSGSGSGAQSSSNDTGMDRSRASSIISAPRGVGGTTPVPTASTLTGLPQLQLPPQELPPIPKLGIDDPLALSSSATPACVELMDALAKDVMAFQQKFFGQIE